MLTFFTIVILSWLFNKIIKMIIKLNTHIKGSKHPKNNAKTNNYEITTNSKHQS